MNTPIPVPIPASTPARDYGYSQDRNAHGYPSPYPPATVDQIRRMLHGPGWWRVAKGMGRGMRRWWRWHWRGTVSWVVGMAAMSGGWALMIESYYHRRVIVDSVVGWVLEAGLVQLGAVVSVVAMLTAAGGWLLDRQK